jgi:hypothetical protein
MITASLLVHQLLDDLDFRQQQGQRSEDQGLDRLDLDKKDQPLGQDQHFTQH